MYVYVYIIVSWLQRFGLAFHPQKTNQPPRWLLFFLRFSLRKRYRNKRAQIKLPGQVSPIYMVTKRCIFEGPNRLDEPHLSRTGRNSQPTNRPASKVQDPSGEH